MEFTALHRSASTLASRPGGESSSLSNLPLELKSLILDEVAEIVDKIAPCEASPFRDRTKWPMRHIALVSREFAALAEPYLWEHVDLERTRTRNLAYFLASILPHHAHHTRHLKVPRIEYNHELYDGTPDQSEAAAVLGRPVAAMDDPILVSQLAFLLTRAIGRMPKLSMVECDLTLLSEVFHQASSDATWRSWNDRGVLARDSSVAGALASLGPRLVTLHLNRYEWDAEDDDNDIDSGNFDYSQGRLASFLSNFPALTSLDVDVVLRAEGRDSLTATLISFHRLKHLDLSISHLINDEFAAAPWVCPLESLYLNGVHAPFSSLYILLAKFSGTLQSLSLTFAQGFDRALATPFLPSTAFPLPHLRWLEVQTPCEGAILLLAFALCPLESIRVYETPTITSSAWHAFIDSHAATLKSLRLLYAPDSTVEPSVWGPGAPLRELCEARGMTCDVGAHAVDSEDEEGVEVGDEDEGAEPDSEGSNE